jgi:hypothetical protein
MNNRFGDRFRDDDREPRRFHDDDDRESTRRFDDREPHFSSGYEPRRRMDGDREPGDRYGSERTGDRGEMYLMDRGQGGFGGWREDAQRRERPYGNWREDMDRDRWREDLGYGRQMGREPQRFSEQIDRGYDRGTDRGFGGIGSGGMNRSWDDDDRGWRTRSIYGGLSQGPEDWRENNRFRGVPPDSLGQQTFGQRMMGAEQRRYPSGPKGYKRSDERIREDICDALGREHDIDSSDVEVKVQNGEVTISGTVPHRHMKLQIEQLADRMSGVNDVNNQIRVKQQQLQQSPQSGQRQQGSFGDENEQNGRRPNVTGRA